MTKRSSHAAPTLAEIQGIFQAALLQGDDRILASILPGAHADRATMLGVYRGAYIARLIGILRSEFPRLAAYAGDEAFNRLSRSYFAAHPSRHRSARWVGDRLPAYLAGDELGRRYPVLVELAALEQALGLAFDAPDAPELSLAGLAAVPLDEWSRLVFRTHPSASRLDLEHNTFAVWSALKDEAEPPAAKREADLTPLLIWRRDGLPFVRRLGAEEAMLWDEAARGATFGRLCELAAVYDDPGTAAVRVAGTVRGWLESGALTGADLPLSAVAAIVRAA